MIDHLVDAFELDRAVELRAACERGLSKFAAMTTEDLLAEARCRGIDPSAGSCRENGDAEGEDFGDAEEPSALLSGLDARNLRLRGEEA